MKDITRTANYGVGELIINGISLAYTKLFWKRARLIRLPSHIRGKRAIQYGSGFTTGYNCRIEINGSLDGMHLIFGEKCVIGDYVHIVANKSVKIGNNVLMASRVFITDSNHGTYAGENQSSPEEEPNKRKMNYQPVVIGDNVWIGENVSILAGVHIGNGCIIGANSVVTNDTPENAIVVGNPAKVVKLYRREENSWRRV